MQLVQSSIGMEFVNAIMEPVLNRMRRRLKPLPRETKRYRTTVAQNLQYIGDDGDDNDDNAAFAADVDKQTRAEEQKEPTKAQDEADEHASNDTNTNENADAVIASNPKINNDDAFDRDDDKDDEKAMEEPQANKATPSGHDTQPLEDERIVNSSATQPFIFLAEKSEATLTEQWNGVLRNVALNLERLEAVQPKINLKTENEFANKILDTKIKTRFSYKALLVTSSSSLSDAIGDLMSAADVTIEDVETSAKCLKYLRAAHKTALGVFRTSNDALVVIWSAALVIVTTFFTATNFLMVEDDDDDKEDASDEAHSQAKKSKQRERSQILRVLSQFDQILYSLDAKEDILHSELQKICQSSLFLTNQQWLLLDSVLEFSIQMSSLQLGILPERINSVIASVLQQYNVGAATGNTHVRYTFPFPYTGHFFTKNKCIEKMKEYYTQRVRVFMAMDSGYYVRGKYRALDMPKPHKITLDATTLKWPAMTRTEKLLLMRVLANQSRLKTIVVETKEFGVDGCAYLAALLSGNLLLCPSDELLYYRLSKLLASLHEQYLWDYIDNHERLSDLIDITDETVLDKINADLQKMLRPFQQIANWKQIKNGVPVDPTVFLRHQKTMYCLQRLILSECEIGDRGVAYLAQALTRNETLLELVLDKNNITDTGATALGNMLSHNVTLRELDVSQNQIGKKGFCAIVVGWQVNKKFSALTALDLSLNKTKLSVLRKDQSIPVDVTVSMLELKESVNVDDF